LANPQKPLGSAVKLKKKPRPRNKRKNI
jgi:hypothetical protein